MFGLRSASSAANRDLLSIIQSASADTGLEFCLDAGSALSFTSGQKWLDLTGNGFDFFLGADGSSGSDDPTFTGTAGDLSSGEYFAFDGGDIFRYDAANETAFNDVHKDDATTTFLIAVYMPDPLAAGAFFGTGFGAVDVGFVFTYNGAAIGYQVLNGSGSVALNTQFDDTPNAGGWNVVAVSVDEAGGAVSFGYLNGSYNQVSASDTFNAAYTSPSSSSATDTLEIGARGDGNQKLPNGARIGAAAMWSRALSKAELDDIYTPLATRYGL